MSYKLACIIVIWRSDEDGLELAQTISGWKDTLVYVIDNEAQGLSNQIGSISYMPQEKNLGFGGGINLALRAIVQKDIAFCLLINPDAYVEESAIAGLINAFRKKPKAFAMSPLLQENGNETAVFSGGRDIAKHVDSRMRYDPNTTKGEFEIVDYCIGACCLLNLNLIDEYDLYFDENYFFNGEMADICQRARKYDLICYTATKFIAYHDRESTSLNPLKLYYNFRNRFLYINKHESSIWRSVQWYAIMLLQFVSFTLKGKLQMARAIRLAAKDAVHQRFGNQHQHFEKLI